METPVSSKPLPPNRPLTWQQQDRPAPGPVDVQGLAAEAEAGAEPLVEVLLYYRDLSCLPPPKQLER